MRRSRKKGSKGPGRPEAVTPERVIDALRKARGIQRYAAQALGVHRHTVANVAKRHPEVQEVIEDEIEGLIDTAEARLSEAITRGELGAIIFFLKTRAKHRGYIERGELTGLNGRPVVSPVDLTKLSTEELEALEKIMVKAQAN